MCCRRLPVAGGSVRGSSHGPPDSSPRPSVHDMGRLWGQLAVQTSKRVRDPIDPRRIRYEPFALPFETCNSSARGHSATTANTLPNRQPGLSIADAFLSSDISGKANTKPPLEQVNKYRRALINYSITDLTMSHQQFPKKSF